MSLNLEYKKIISILKKDVVGVIPTDTLYGIVGSALSKRVVERIYKIKGRNEKKPFIILISSLNDLKKFGVDTQNPILHKVWPGPVSIILPHTSMIVSNKFKYLNRGTGSLAFRLPKKKSVLEILKKTGPLVAPSANPEGLPPAETILEAKKYFRNKVDFYVPGGKLKSNPSTLIKINKEGKIDILRGILKYNGK